jgi:hypothetical protein
VAHIWSQQWGLGLKGHGSDYKSKFLGEDMILQILNKINYPFNFEWVLGSSKAIYIPTLFFTGA